MDDELTAVLADLPGPDVAAGAAVAARAAQVLRPAGALARLDEVAAWLASWQRTTTPRVARPAVVVFAADHGVVDEGVSAYPSAVTAEMLRALRTGAATATVMARELGAPLEVVDVGVGRPSANLRREAALDAARFRECLDAGRRAVADLDADIVVFGEMGIGNTTPAAAVSAALFGGPAEEWTGRGTGIDDATWAIKVAVVDDACRRLPDDCEPLEVLREVGGPELVGIAGAVLEARRRSIPVILDGFVATAAVAPLEATRPGALDHCVAGHCSGEPGHR
ncbi:MAG: nicotinate-nucleotide--dimethylbenzimidazole phosphoribosyltransferase, partial [Acidimicrobiia bacterium]|nr:nicotinate-nucleotide--dimethylbenzimidazole phosphoribosyltransferase [Acidimicrobiia bacterium]